ncbi:TonB-dependent receptor [Flagellatimonas centrodinii]|uniref:TonB-dependent receptor n=1 Tax=Flagellatimonas centrodinii TaxID=2806210 RepID=UPI001FED4B10|nr:TonB-dependent receptor [Flagellatimonas centrodinii]ULQ48025.1 TonB-dependent receptor [Flagellatimonas centrodinii]
MQGIKRLTVAGALCALASTAIAQDTGSISGRVTDASGDIAFEGARIRIQGLAAEAVSARDGRFSFPALPPGDYRLVITYLGAPEKVADVQLTSGERERVFITLGSEATRMENVLVVGQVAGQAAALNQALNADGLKDVISADAIGQFPDQNVAEALARAPGLSLFRDQGEGRFLVVRGIDPAFTATTVNGLRVPAPEGGTRQVNLDVISSDLLESAEIQKTNLPDMDGDTVGGTIELKTATAFDRGNTLSLRAEGSYNEQNDETSPKLAASLTRLLSLGGKVNNVGVSAAVSWFERDFGSEGVETPGFEELEGPTGDVLGLEEAEQRDYTITRERLSAALNFDWRPSADLDLYWRNLYSDFSDDEVQLSNVYGFGEGDITALDGRVGQFAGIEVEKLDEARKETQTILSTLLGAQQRIDRWTLDYRLGYSLAEEDNPGEFNAAFVGEDIAAAYDLGNREIPLLGGTSAVYFDPATYELDEIERGDSLIEDDELQLAFDAQRDLDWGRAPGFWKAGIKYRSRTKTSDIDVQVFDGFGDDYTLADFAAQTVDYRLGNWGPISARNAVRAFADANQGDFELDADGSAIDSRLEDYRVEEDVLAGYLMAQANWGALRVTGGVRVERTDYAARGIEAAVDEENGSGDPTFTAQAFERQFTDVLPSVAVRYEVRENLVVRGGYSHTLARPTFEAAAPFANIEIEEDDGEFERAAELGNPALDPLQAQNLDLAIAWYPGSVSVLSAGVFYKRLKDFFVQSDIAGEPGPYADFDEAFIVLNGDTATLYGLELNAVRQLDRLPAPWNGLLISANLTLTDGEATLPFRDQKVPLPRQSETLGNVAIGFEDARWSLRLAANYRSEFLDEINELDDPTFDRYADSHLQYDFSGRYRVSETWQVYLNAVNLSDEPFYAYFADRAFNSQYEEYGRTFELGVKASF